MIKEVMILGILAILTLIMPLFIFVFLPPLMISLWITGIFALFFTKRNNPKIVAHKRYQLFENLLYFQLINWAFAFFIFIPVLNLIAMVILIVMMFLLVNKEKRTSDKYKKWAKYIGFHVFNLVLILILWNNFPDVGLDAFAIIPLITFFNGLVAAAYFKFMNRLPADRKSIVLLILFLLMTARTVVSSFPQASGIPIIELIFRGGS